MRLISSDGRSFQTSMSVMKISTTLNSMMDASEEDDIDDADVPVPNVNGEILHEIVRYCERHANDPKKSISAVNDDAEKDDELMSRPMASFVKELLFAAHYLDISNLTDLCCKAIGKYLDGSEADEVRAFLGIEHRKD